MMRDWLMGRLAALSLAAGIAFLAGCGGGGGGGISAEVAGPKATAMVQGTVDAAPKAVKSGVSLAAAGDPIVVTLAGQPAITATVGADGTFTLRGLPEGRFTLEFRQGGDLIGTLEFAEVAANQQITIRVQVVDGEVVLLDEDRRGIGNAGIELEGLVEAILSFDPAGDGTFSLAGRTVIVRPGVTAIRKGAERKTFQDLAAGMRVHVKGARVEGSTDVLAHQVIIQNPGSPETAGGEQIEICHVPPGNPSKKKTITIDASAWPAHQAHGDTKGAC